MAHVPDSRAWRFSHADWARRAIADVAYLMPRARARISATASPPSSCRPISSRSASTRSRSASWRPRRCSARRRMTLGDRLLAPRYDLRTLLLICAFLMVATGIAHPAVPASSSSSPLIAFVGTMNPSTGDIGVLVPLEHAMLAHGVADQERTRAFARYSLIGALSIAAGALAAAAPDLLVAAGIGQVGALQAMFYVYAALGLAGAALYSPPAARRRRRSRAASAPLGPSRGTVYKLAALFSLDPFAGGFVGAVAAGAVAVRAVRSVARRPRACSSSGRACSAAFSYPVAALAGAAHRPRQHDGVHAHPVEHLSHPGGVLAEPRRSRSRCCCCAPRCRRWTCRRAPPT